MSKSAVHRGKRKCKGLSEIKPGMIKKHEVDNVDEAERRLERGHNHPGPQNVTIFGNVFS